MARQSVSIPSMDRLPTEDTATKLIVEYLNKPNFKLFKHTPMDTFFFKGGPEPMRTWFVGSSVWLPAVKGEAPDPLADFDIFFKDAGTSAEFTKHMLGWFAETDPDETATYAQEENVFGGPKIVRSWTTWEGEAMTRGLIDCWDLPRGATIAEIIHGFPHAHERVAFLASSAPGEIGALTRLVRPLSTTDLNRGQSQKYKQKNKPVVDYSGS